MEKIPERRRKSKGSLSVLDEFTGDAGAISFTPQINEDVQRRIDEKTKLADAPSAKAPPPLLNKVEPKLESKLVQSGAKVEPKLGQSVSKLESKLSQKVEPKKSTFPKVEPQPEPKVEPLLSQSEAKVEPNLPLAALVGLQRRALLLVYESCRNLGSKISDPISIQNIAESANTTAAAARKAVQRLEQKSFVTRVHYKDGRGGWTQYGLPDRVYNALLIHETRAKVEPKLSQTRAKVSTELEPQLEPSPSSSSSRDLLIKESTTTAGVDKSAWLAAIDMSAVEPSGVTRSVLLRCLDLYPAIQPEKLEDLVFRFGEYLKDPRNKVQNARGFFISLAEQLGKGQLPLDDIETPGERLMREYVERKKEAKARAAEIEQKAFEFELETWLEKLTSQEKFAAVPETSILKPGTPAHTAMLKNHFAENVWPECRQRILEDAANS